MQGKQLQCLKYKTGRFHLHVFITVVNVLLQFSQQAQSFLFIVVYKHKTHQLDKSDIDQDLQINSGERQTLRNNRMSAFCIQVWYGMV